MAMEKILSNLVLLRPLLPGVAPPAPVAPEVIESIASKMGRPQIKDSGAVAFGLAGAPVAIVSVRDQLSVDLQPDRVRIEDESRQKPFSPHFWEIVAHIEELLRWEFKPFGFNFQAMIEHEGIPSRDVVAGIFNTEQITSRLGKDVEIDTATIRFISDVSTGDRYVWKVKIEHRFQDPNREATFVDANAHFDRLFETRFSQEISEEVFTSFSEFSAAFWKWEALGE